MTFQKSIIGQHFVSGIEKEMNQGLEIVTEEGSRQPQPQPSSEAHSCRSYVNVIPTSLLFMKADAKRVESTTSMYRN